ncbi:MAG: hypothetical protein N2045_14350, partial [Fimbriimonadales bacterium]|nr:hypothetical protein [Fimbriimonadales bacterium]
YLLRTQSWARYGAIDVEISIPAQLRLRTLPIARYAEQRDGRRIYRARLNQPKGNLHVVVAERDAIYEYPVVIAEREPGEKPILYSTDLRVRMLDGEPYAPFQAFAPSRRRPPVQAQGTTLRIGKRAFSLRYPVRIVEGALYVHLRDALAHDFAYYLSRSEYEAEPGTFARTALAERGVGANARFRYDARRGLVILERPNAYAGGAR